MARELRVSDQAKKREATGERSEGLTNVVDRDHLERRAVQARIKESHAEERSHRAFPREVVVESGRRDDCVAEPGFLQGNLDLGLGFEVWDTAVDGGVRDRCVDQVRQADGVGSFDKVVALLVLVDSAVNTAEGHCEFDSYVSLWVPLTTSDGGRT